MPRLPKKKKNDILAAYIKTKDPAGKIAAKHGVSRRTVTRLAREAGLTGRGRKVNQKIRNKIEVPRETRRKIIRLGRETVRSEGRVFAKNSQKKIAEECNLPVSIVRRIFKEEGIRQETQAKKRRNPEIAERNRRIVELWANLEGKINPETGKLYTYQDIGKMTECKADTVFNVLKNARAAAEKKGVGLAAHIGVTSSAVKGLIEEIEAQQKALKPSLKEKRKKGSERNKKEREERAVKILRLHRQGYTYQEIANIINSEAAEKSIKKITVARVHQIAKETQEQRPDLVERSYRPEPGKTEYKMPEYLKNEDNPEQAAVIEEIVRLGSIHNWRTGKREYTAKEIAEKAKAFMKKNGINLGGEINIGVVDRILKIKGIERIHSLTNNPVVIRQVRNLARQVKKGKTRYSVEDIAKKLKIGQRVVSEIINKAKLRREWPEKKKIKKDESRGYGSWKVESRKDLSERDAIIVRMLKLNRIGYNSRDIERRLASEGFNITASEISRILKEEKSNKKPSRLMEISYQSEEPKLKRTKYPVKIPGKIKKRRKVLDEIIRLGSMHFGPNLPKGEKLEKNLPKITNNLFPGKANRRRMKIVKKVYENAIPGEKMFNERQIAEIIREDFEGTENINNTDISRTLNALRMERIRGIKENPIFIKRVLDLARETKGKVPKYSASDIAERVGIHVNRVYEILHDAGLKGRMDAGKRARDRKIA